MTDHDHDIDRDLEEVFDAARRVPVRPDADFMAAMLARALEVQDGFAAGSVPGVAPGAAPVAEPPRRFGFGLLAGLGGWPALAGLATAAVAGIWLGFSPALGVGDVVASAWDQTTDSSYVIDYGASYTLALYDGGSQ